MSKGRRSRPATKARKAKKTTPATRLWPTAALLAALVGAGAATLGVLVLRDGGPARPDPGPVHVHGLGVNPADGSLFIATHTGMYRTDRDASRPERVGRSAQDTMGFTVAGPDHFLGSGHPDLREDLPPLLGLIESTDAGETWEPVSLLGEADFHVLRFAGDRVYGYDASNDRLLVSADRGRGWQKLERPGVMLDLVVHPSSRDHLVSSAQGPFGPALFSSRDAGESWSVVGRTLGYLAWPAADRLYAVRLDGDVLRSRDAGATFERVGRVGGEPAAFLASGDTLYVGLHDGTIEQSLDAGASWTVRSLP